MKTFTYSVLNARDGGTDSALECWKQQEIISVRSLMLISKFSGC